MRYPRPIKTTRSVVEVEVLPTQGLTNTKLVWAVAYAIFANVPQNDLSWLTPTELRSSKTSTRSDSFHPLSPGDDKIVKSRAARRSRQRRLNCMHTLLQLNEVAPPLVSGSTCTLLSVLVAFLCGLVFLPSVQLIGTVVAHSVERVDSAVDATMLVASICLNWVCNQFVTFGLNIMSLREVDMQAGRRVEALSETLLHVQSNSNNIISALMHFYSDSVGPCVESIDTILLDLVFRSKDACLYAAFWLNHSFNDVVEGILPLLIDVGRRLAQIDWVEVVEEIQNVSINSTHLKCILVIVVLLFGASRLCRVFHRPTTRKYTEADVTIDDAHELSQYYKSAQFYFGLGDSLLRGADDNVRPDTKHTLAQFMKAHETGEYCSDELRMAAYLLAKSLTPRDSDDHIEMYERTY